MQYGLVELIWFFLSGIWGLLGTLIGPGIVKLIIAMGIGVLGSLVTIIKILCAFEVRVLSTWLLVTLFGIVFVGIIDIDAVLTWPTAIFFTVFVSTLSFTASLLVNRTIKT